MKINLVNSTLTKKNSSNQLFSNFFSKNVIFTKFLPKMMCDSKFLQCGEESITFLWFHRIFVNYWCEWNSVISTLWHSGNGNLSSNFLREINFWTFAFSKLLIGQFEIKGSILILTHQNWNSVHQNWFHGISEYRRKKYWNSYLFIYLIESFLSQILVQTHVVSKFGKVLC